MAADVDAAIAASEQRQASSFRGTVTLPSSGRQVGLVVPADISAQELLDLAGFVTTALPREIAKAAAPRPRLILPTQ